MSSGPVQAWGNMPQAAAYCGVSRGTIRRMMRRGLKHSRMPSNRVLIRFSDIDEYLEQFRVDPNARVDAIVAELMEGL